jgi:uncharacterized protein (DUF433 family)
MREGSLARQRTDGPEAGREESPIMRAAAPTLRPVPASNITEAYPADRAAALAGVPKSTLHYWARNGIWLPSVSPDEVRLWSLSDILVLRLFYWLRRRDKLGADDLPMPRTKMPQVRAAATRILSNELSPVSTRVFVDAKGNVLVRDETHLEDLGGQQHLGEGIALLREYRVDEERGVVGPDLVRPRPLLRIVPGKLAGEPHVENTRVSTTMLDAMVERGYRPNDIRDLYPFLTTEAINDARALEQQLRRNLRSDAA